MIEMSASEFIRSFCLMNVLFLLIFVLLGMNTSVFGRPVEWSDSSAEDILAGVDFLSVFMNSAEERKNYNHKPEVTTYRPALRGLTKPEKFFEDIQQSFDNESPTTINNHIINDDSNDIPTTIDNTFDVEEPSFTTILPEQDLTESNINIENENLQILTTIIPIKDKVIESISRTVTSESNPSRFLPKSEENSTENTSKKVSFIKNTSSAIQANSKRNDFSVDESDPITVDSTKSDIKVKRKSEDLLAIGANPDYIAQQHARINRENQYNSPYNHRDPSPSRGRSVSYSAVIQVLPPGNPNLKNWKQEDESRLTNSRSNNPVIAETKDYDSYDYTESYPDYPNHNNNNKTTFPNQHIASTAESKDYFVTRKYNPIEFNESADKNINQQKTNLDSKKNYQTTERNWGLPEKNYGIPEKNYGIQNSPALQYNPQDQNINPQRQLPKLDNPKNYQTTERPWGASDKNYGIQESQHRSPPIVYGRPEQNYEVDESVSVMTNGRSHGIQDSSFHPTPKVNEKPLQFKVGQNPVKPDDNQKIGYVVEGRNYRKYRVEERTADGFIVGEYGVVSNNDGSLRGVRYTADGTINPRVIYDALMKFLSL